MAHHWSPRLAWLGVFLLSLLSTALTQDEEEPISVGAPVTAVEVGQEATLECSTTLQGQSLVWFRGSNGTDQTSQILESESSRIHANRTTGVLTFQNARLNDTGTYLCQTENGTHPVTAELHVYEKSDYFTEGMIIFGINLGLVAVFFICCIYTYVQKRRDGKAKRAAILKKKTTGEL